MPPSLIVRPSCKRSRLRRKDAIDGWGARSSRPLPSASRRRTAALDRTPKWSMKSNARAVRRDAEQSDRDGRAPLCRPHRCASEHKNVLQLQLCDVSLFLKLFEVEFGFVADDRDELVPALEVLFLELHHVGQAEALDFLEARFARIDRDFQPFP